MTASVQHLMLLLCLVFGTAFAADGIDWFFDSTHQAPRAVLLTLEGQISHQMPKFAFTFCFYTYIENRLNEDVTFISYASQDDYEANEVYFHVNYLNSYTALSIRGQSAVFQVVPKRNAWTHICVSWTFVNGEVHYYLNGKDQRASYYSSNIVRPGYTLAGHGCLVMGQDQDYYNDLFDPTQGLTGGLTQVNIWDHVLSPAEVKSAQNCNLTGNLVDWNNGLWGLSDNVMLRSTTAPCYVSCGEVHRSSRRLPSSRLPQNLQMIHPSVNPAGIQVKSVSGPATTNSYTSPSVTFTSSVPKTTIQYTSPQKTIHYTSTQKTIHYTSPQKTIQHPSPQKTIQHPSPQKTIQHASPQKTTQYTSPQKTIQYTSPQKTIQHTSPQKTIQHPGPQKTIQYTSPQKTVQHTSPQKTIQHTSHQKTIQYTSPQKTIQHTSRQKTIQYTSPQKTVQHTSPQKTIQHTSRQKTIQYTSPQKTTQYTSPQKTIQHTGPQKKIQAKKVPETKIPTTGPKATPSSPGKQDHSILKKECTSYSQCPTEPCFGKGKLRTCTTDTHTCSCKACAKSSECPACPKGKNRSCAAGTCTCKD